MGEDGPVGEDPGCEVWRFVDVRLSTFKETWAPPSPETHENP